MDTCIDLGIKGLQLQPGEHVCGLYAGAQQRDEILLPFLRAGLKAGDKCICIVDGTEPTEIVAALSAPGVENIAAGPKQLDVMRTADAYLRSGTFSAAETIATWKAAISEVMYLARFSRLRTVGTFLLHDVGARQGRAPASRGGGEAFPAAIPAGDALSLRRRPLRGRDH